MPDFKRERVLFHVIGQGSIEIEYEVGAETPEQKFRALYDGKKVRGIRLRELLHNADDFDHVLTVSTEPDQDCPDCEGTGMVMHGPNEVTCGTCEGAKTYGGRTIVEDAESAASGEAPF